MGANDPEELFCLRWNDYRDNVVTTLSDLRREEDFFDVTLAVDSRQVRAHKLILSACSLFFRRLLRANPAPNPIIVLWDVAFDDVVNLLDFMYNGEVKVRHSNIQTFLALAERFRVRGLCQNDSASGRTTPVAAGTTSTSTAAATSNSRRRSEDSSPSGTRSWHQMPASPALPNSASRRGSDEADAAAVKRGRYRADDDDDDIGSSRQHIKSEHSHKDEGRHRGGSSGSRRRPSSRSDLIEDSQMSHSAADSDIDYDYGMEGPSGGASGIPASLMGFPPGIDTSAAKEFWRRAAALGVGLAHGDGYRGSLSSPGGGGSGGASSGSPGGDMPRRQRSVFTSQQVAQLEAYFRVSEYIDGERKKELSNLTNLPEQQIKVWFQNRRQKKKRESDPDYMGSEPPGRGLPPVPGGSGLHHPPYGRSPPPDV